VRRQDRELTDRSILTDILHRADCVHLALIDGDRPYLVTVNFGWT